MAQWMELKEQTSKIVRPRQLYLGETDALKTHHENLQKTKIEYSGKQ